MRRGGTDGTAAPELEFLGPNQAKPNVMRHATSDDATRCCQGRTNPPPSRTPANNHNKKSFKLLGTTMKLAILLFAILLVSSFSWADGQLQAISRKLITKDGSQFQDVVDQAGRVLIACDATFECDSRRDGEIGSFVCRSWTHPITGELQSRAVCVPTTRISETDVCGCCEDEQGGALECPATRDFESLDCPAETQPELPDSVTAVFSSVDHAVRPSEEVTDQLPNAQIICRSLVNPFTGESEPETLIIRGDLALEGDTCGCCDGVCPESGEPVFERPENVVKLCRVQEPDNYFTCDLPAIVQDALAANGFDDVQGFFVCRSFFDPRGLGEIQQEAICIPQGFAWETDTCGCCGTSCPENPQALNGGCTEDESNNFSCDLQNGDEGVFVCRTIFHPLDGQVLERTLCIPPTQGWVTDVCGCCESECPTKPDGGFEDESTQMTALALEIPEDDATSSGSSTVQNSSCMGAKVGAGILVLSMIAVVEVLFD